MPDLGILIVSWNVRELLADCVQSVLSAPHTLSSEIVLVDNASSDGSADMIGRRFPQVRLIRSEKNLGFAGGNNLGLRAWGLAEDGGPGSPPPRYVILLNPDTLVRGDALGEMVRFMDATPDAGMCGARLVYGDGSFQHSAFAFPGLWQIALDAPGIPGRLIESPLNGRYPRRLYAAGRPFRVGHPLGATMLVRTEAIRQVGLMDEAYHMYCEEVDWAWRMAQAGWPAYCVPAAEIVHYSGQSTRQVRAEMVVALWTSRLRLYQKHYPAWKLGLARTLVQRKMQEEKRRADAALARGEMDRPTHLALSNAYLCVIDLFRPGVA